MEEPETEKEAEELSTTKLLDIYQTRAKINEDEITTEVLSATKSYFTKTRLFKDAKDNAVPTKEMVAEFISGRNTMMDFTLGNSAETELLIVASIYSEEFFRRYARALDDDDTKHILGHDFKDIKMLGMVLTDMMIGNGAFNGDLFFYNVTAFSRIGISRMDEETRKLVNSGAFKSVAYDVLKNMALKGFRAYGALANYELEMMRFMITELEGLTVDDTDYVSRAIAEVLSDDVWEATEAIRAKMKEGTADESDWVVKRIRETKAITSEVVEEMTRRVRRKGPEEKARFAVKVAKKAIESKMKVKLEDAK
jgi:hypothetical protein